MSWDSGSFELALLFGSFVIIGCVALFVDYLKSYNEQLRERNIDLSARQQERDRWFGNSPEAFAEKIAGLLRSAQGLPAATVPAISGASARARHRAASYAAAAAPQESALQQMPPLSPEEGEPDAEDARGSSTAAELSEEIAERRPRSRARREGSPSENWVSKEELEKLAERAARIRARYGTMTTDEPVASLAEAVEAVAAEAAPEVAPEAAPQVEHNDAPEGSIETPSQPTGATPEWSAILPASEAAAHTIEPTSAHSEHPAPSQIGWPGTNETAAETQDTEAEAGMTALSQTPAPPHGMPEAEIGDEPNPEWGIPSSPAQARISAAVESRNRLIERTQETSSSSLELGHLPIPGAASRTSSTPAPAGLAAVPSYSSAEGSEVAEHFDEHHVAESFQNSGDAEGATLDALFDQTYGSPTWLAMNGQEPGAALDSILPTGLFEGLEFNKLMEEAPAFTGVAVSIRINDFASVKPKLNSVEGIEAMGALSNLIRSLLREDRDFAGKSQEDEYVLLFPGDIGDEGQRRLFHLSERLWDFQLRSLGGLALMLSWGGLEIEGQSVPEAVSAARDRLEESRRGRAKPGSTFRSARRAS